MYAYSPEILPPVIVAIFLAGLSLFSWQRRRVPGALPLAVGSLLAALYLLGLALESTAISPDARIAWHKFQAALPMPMVTASAFFALEYAQPGRWLNRRTVLLVSIPSLLVLLFVVIGDSQMMWRRLVIEPDGAIVPYYSLPGTILVAIGFCLILVNFVALIWLFVRSPQHRWPVILLLFGALVARGFYMLSLSRLPLPLSIDPVIITFCSVSVTYAIVLFGFHILEPLAVARQAVIEQMQAGVVVFDVDWKVVSLNPAGETILGQETGAARGKTWRALASAGDVLPALPATELQDRNAAAEFIEFSLGRGPNIRHITATLSALQDFRGMTVGRLLMLHDVTEQSHAQAQIVEQQRALAMLQERERLGRELHDSIGQVLGYAGFQADAANC